MNKKHGTMSVSFLLANLLFVGLLISSCAPGQLFEPILTSTSTTTPTPTITITPNITLSPTVMLTPTLSVEEVIGPAVQTACQGKSATSKEVGVSTTEPAGAWLCPDAESGLILPEEWMAKTPGNLRYVVNVQNGTTK